MFIQIGVNIPVTQGFKMKNNNHLCPAAWTSVYVSPSGRLENCCLSKNALGPIADVEDVDSFYKTGKNLQIQEKMIANQPVRGCEVCNNNNDWNYKKSFIQKYPNLDYKPGEFDFKFFDIRWSNACNLACMYCTPEFSSTWAHEVKDHSNMSKTTTNALLDYTLENIENLDYVYLAGGEPLMMKENEIFLAELAEKNPNCEVLVNSNISMVGKTKIYDSLKKMTNVRWLVSMETMDDQFEYVRYPANWKTTKENLFTLKQDFGEQAITFGMVYGNFNALSIWDTIDWVVDNGFIPKNISIQIVSMGARGHFDIYLLSREYLDSCLERIQSNIELYSQIHTLKDTKKYLETIPLDRFENKIQDKNVCLQYLQQLDKRRSLDSRSVFPDIYSELGKIK